MVSYRLGGNIKEICTIQGTENRTLELLWDEIFLPKGVELRNHDINSTIKSGRHEPQNDVI